MIRICGEFVAPNKDNALRSFKALLYPFSEQNAILWSEFHFARNIIFKDIVTLLSLTYKG